MDYKKLADMLYPHIDKDINYYKQLYKPRDLSEGAEVTRLAPSPTGFMHVGSLFQAVIQHRLANRTNGVFYFRLEDTDQKREIKGASSVAYNALVEFDLTPDEGYRGEANTEIGNYGPYVQSKRLNIYHAFAKEMVAKGVAYPCFCEKTESKEDVLKRREEQLDSSDTLENKDACRNLTLDDVSEFIKAGKPFALRLKSQGDSNNIINFHDRIKGDREIRENTKDIVLIKNNGIPVYAFAHLVDDTLMGTTTVIRGEEWYQSLASHLELFKLCGQKAPNYAHTPVISKLENNNKRKISKRKDPEADVRYYAVEGYPATAVIEYLINLANSDFEDWRKNNPTSSYKEFPFSVDKIGSNNPIFDFNKLNDISKNVFARMTATEVFEGLAEWAKEQDKGFYDYLINNKKYVTSVLNIDREGTNPRKDIYKYSEIKSYYNYMFTSLNNINLNFENYEKYDKKLLIKLYEEYVNNFNENDTKEEWFNKIKQLAEANNFCTNNKEYKLNPDAYLGNTAALCTLIRIMVTGKQQTPDLYSICVVLGKNKLKENINILKSKLQ